VSASLEDIQDIHDLHDLRAQCEELSDLLDTVERCESDAVSNLEEAATLAKQMLKNIRTLLDLARAEQEDPALDEGAPEDEA
jgi:hypothetical protein